ncbi:MAG: DEAD/DEAH box helicase [Chlamydiae bacterium]|nr:DEAD/DEAH box helicase [Chlamydiota bacterium]
MCLLRGLQGIVDPYYGDLMGFTRLNLHKKILEKLEKLEFSSPTPIQEQAIPHILEGKDMLASADTGTGKTAAFLLPAIHLLAEREAPSEGPTVLILSPTRELATQIEKEVTRFSCGLKHIKSVVVFGGASWSEQVKKVSKPHDILVATPGRLIDLMEKNKVDLSQVDLLVIDEADRMLDMGFVEPVNLIASKTNPDRQTLLFSATLKGPVLKLCANLTINPVRVEIEKKEMEVENIQEHFYYTHDIAHKHRLLSEILQKEGVDQAIVFTSTKRAADELTDRLSDEGFDTAALHGDMKQRQRDRTLRYLHAKKIRVLVATDVAARGIDVATITHVINFDLPMQVEDYIHRIGRTGRAGATGEAHSFASKRDRGVVKDIEKLTKKSYEIYMDSKGESKEKDFQRPSKSRSKDREFQPRRSFSEQGESRERKPFSRDREFSFKGSVPNSEKENLFQEIVSLMEKGQKVLLKKVFPMKRAFKTRG